MFLFHACDAISCHSCDFKAVTFHCNIFLLRSLGRCSPCPSAWLFLCRNLLGRHFLLQERNASEGIIIIIFSPSARHWISMLSQDGRLQIYDATTMGAAIGAAISSGSNAQEQPHLFLSPSGWQGALLCLAPSCGGEGRQPILNISTFEVDLCLKHQAYVLLRRHCKEKGGKRKKSHIESRAFSPCMHVQKLAQRRPDFTRGI